MNGELKGMAIRMFWWIVAILAAGFVGFAVYLYFAQGKLVFYPSRTMEVTPSEAGIPYEDVYVESLGGVRINGWFVGPKDSTAPVVLICHGNAGNISHRLESILFFCKLGAGVLVFDYRGYGRSEGSPGEAEVYADAKACYDWLTESKGVGSERIVVYGESLGGSVAADLASKQECRGLIVESTFTSIADMGRRMFPVLPVGLLVRYEFNTVEKIQRVRCPVLVTHSPDDETVPYEMGERLYSAARPPKRFVRLSGGHNDREYFGQEMYRVAVQEILSGEARGW